LNGLCDEEFHYFCVQRILSVITFPNAKINLGLQVLSKRSDGFHNIATGMYPIPFCDILEILPAADGLFGFASSGLPIDGIPDHNLCIKALRLLSDDYALPAVRIHLHKRIPMGAGLGGGSSDGAYTLKMLNAMFDLGLGLMELENYASMLGSDAPFFVRNQPVVATGRGEVMSPATVSLAGLTLVLVRPDFRIATAEGYQGVVPNDHRASMEGVLRQPVTGWRESLVNDFEPFVFRKFPQSQKIKEDLYRHGAVYAQMTGSGSVFYGLFSDMPDLPASIRQQVIYAARL
jgi:4-diphosphocytidyl-2-C-methyl-D-erythritol kinase